MACSPIGRRQKIYVHIYTHMCTYMHMCVYIYIYTYIYLYTVSYRTDNSLVQRIGRRNIFVKATEQITVYYTYCQYNMN